MTRVVINPGTEPQPDATLENATESMRRFVRELEVDGGITPLRFEHQAEKDHLGGLTQGYYAFIILFDDDPWHKPSVNIDMPGCDPDRAQASEPWYSPRLYVDGSSWLWGLALGFADEALTGREE